MENNSNKIKDIKRIKEEYTSFREFININGETVYKVSLNIEPQYFSIEYQADGIEEAEWMGKQLATALWHFLQKEK